MASCGIIDRIRDLTQSEETDIKNLGMIFMETFEAKFSQWESWTNIHAPEGNLEEKEISIEKSKNFFFFHIQSQKVKRVARGGKLCLEQDLQKGDCLYSKIFLA